MAWIPSKGPSRGTKESDEVLVPWRKMAGGPFWRVTPFFFEAKRPLWGHSASKKTGGGPRLSAWGGDREVGQGSGGGGGTGQGRGGSRVEVRVAGGGDG